MSTTLVPLEMHLWLSQCGKLPSLGASVLFAGFCLTLGFSCVKDQHLVCQLVYNPALTVAQVFTAP